MPNSSKSIFIYDDSLSNEGDDPRYNALEVSIYYSKGGLNYFSGDRGKRGIWLLIKKVEKKDGGVCFMIGGSGDDGAFRSLLQEMGRANAKKLDAIAGKVFAKLESNQDLVLGLYKIKDKNSLLELVNDAAFGKEAA